MLTRLRVKNFKTLEDVDLPLGPNVVFVGPNNSGKTSALQALSLWQTGLTEWRARRATNQAQLFFEDREQRNSVAINRRSLTHTPVADARMLWRDLDVGATQDSVGRSSDDVLLRIIVDGETPDGEAWTCGLEFHYANSESFYCRPVGADGVGLESAAVPEAAFVTRIAALPPMAGLASEEPELHPGRIAVLLGEGQTAQVLRNLCFQVSQSDAAAWNHIVAQMHRIFGVRLQEPTRDAARGAIGLTYRQNDTIELDLSSAGRGMQQTLLLLAHLSANPGNVLLLDEPDAHLEILRQRQIYSLITEAARKAGSQIIAASHSEVILNEAADKDVVIAFVGRPHRIDDRGTQLLKSLREIGFDQYYQAELKGLVIYLEGATDLSILKALAEKLGHPAAQALDEPFVHYVGNVPPHAQNHYFGLREAKKDLRAVAVFDRLPQGLPQGFPFPAKVWSRREIENYLCSREILLRYARGMEPDDLIGRAVQQQREDAMLSAIEKVEQAIRTLGKDPWSADFKVSDEFLPAIFSHYFSLIGQDNRMRKADFHLLADFVAPEEVDSEIIEALDIILREAQQVNPPQ